MLILSNWGIDHVHFLECQNILNSNNVCQEDFVDLQNVFLIFEQLLGSGQCIAIKVRMAANIKPGAVKRVTTARIDHALSDTITGTQA